MAPGCPQPTPVPKAWKMHSCSSRCCPRDCCVPVEQGRGSSVGFLESPLVGCRDRWGWQWEPGCFSWCLLGREPARELPELLHRPQGCRGQEKFAFGPKKPPASFSSFHLSLPSFSQAFQEAHSQEPVSSQLTQVHTPPDSSPWGTISKQCTENWGN